MPVPNLSGRRIFPPVGAERDPVGWRIRRVRKYIRSLRPAFDSVTNGTSDSSADNDSRGYGDCLRRGRSQYRDCGDAHWAQSQWVTPRRWCVPDVAVEIRVSTLKLDRILAEEPPEPRGVVPRPVVVEARAVVLPARELMRVRGGLPGGGRVAERCVGVLRLDRPAAISQGEWAPQGVCEQRSQTGGVGPGEDLVEAQSREQIRDGSAREQAFLDRVQAVVQRVRLRRVDGLRPAAAERVVAEAGGEPRPGETRRAGSGRSRCTSWSRRRWRGWPGSRSDRRSWSRHRTSAAGGWHCNSSSPPRRGGRCGPRSRRSRCGCQPASGV